MSKHYVARVVFEVVDRQIISESYGNKPATYGDRQVTELGNVLVKGNDLTDVKERLFRAAAEIEDM